MAKKVTGQVKLQIPAGKATPAPPVGTALGPQGVNIMEFCQGIQRAKTSREGSGRSHHPRGDHDLLRSLVYLHHQDASGPGAHQARSRCRQGFSGTAQNEGRQDHAEASRGDRQNQNARSQLLRCRSRHAFGQRHRPLHGHRRSLIKLHVGKGARDKKPAPFLFVRHEFANVLVGIMPALLAHRLRQSTEFNQTMQHTVTALRARPFLV